jgi:hypothetical protein
VAVTDPVVADVYNLQIEADAGPLVEALRNQETVLIATPEPMTGGRTGPRRSPVSESAACWTFRWL